MKCSHCGNDGGADGLYLAIDARWRPDLGAWELQQREDQGGTALDCLECDGQTTIDRAAAFPFGLHLPPHSADIYRESALILAALRMWQAGGRNRLPFMDIATNAGEHAPLTGEEIDRLCERFGGAAL